jgi:Ca-activated chloride channel family protein
VLTDGQVSNTEAVLELVRRHSDTTRVFAFGIGAGASHHLVRGMARAGGGAAEFIAPGERIEGKVLRQFQKALAPAVSDVRVDWGGLEARQAPHRVPPVFAGERLLVYGFLEADRMGAVTLEGRGPRGPISFRLHVDPGATRAGSLIATLAARTMIRDLEEGASPLHDRRGSLQERGGKDRVKAEIVRLGVSYGLCSRETSFVAVEKRETPVAGGAQLRRVPVALTSGWGGLAGGPSHRAPPAANIFSPGVRPGHVRCPRQGT